MSLAMAGAVAAGATAQSYKFHDDGEVALLAIPDGGVLEPAIPLYYRGTRVDDPGTSGPDAYTIIDFYDRVPGTGSYPLSGADIIANGFIRPLVQRADGTASAFGTSIITGPSFREQGLPLDLIPDMTRADVVTGDPHGEDRIIVQGQGFNGGKAILVCQRRWPDPAIGRTSVPVTYAWHAATDIPLAGGANGRGFDAFRLATLSSMLADTDSGQYDARYLRVVDPQGRARTIEVPDAPRARHLFPSPRPVAPGGSFALLKDNAASWNPGSPTIEIIIDSVTSPVGQVGVQAYLADTVNPNDDSLSVWLEWIDAPPVISAGTRIDVQLRIVATPATDPGDLDHDGGYSRADGVLAFGLLRRTENDADFDAYADLDRDRDIDDEDFDALVVLIGEHPADFTGDGQVDTRDVIAFLGAFAAGEAAADLNADHAVNTLDVILYLNLFAYAT
jgi:hypothetical protein